MTAPRKRKSHGGGRGFSGATEAYQALYAGSEATTSARQRKGWREPHLPAHWRDRLPNPRAYYSGRLERLSVPNASGWAQARCPFHEDRNASLSVNFAEAAGGWRCFAGCGSGDLVAFHMRVTGLAFRDAVLDLLGKGSP